jgi:hypothetical protein
MLATSPAAALPSWRMNREATFAALPRGAGASITLRASRRTGNTAHSTITRRRIPSCGNGIRQHPLESDRRVGQCLPGSAVNPLFATLLMMTRRPWLPNVTG